MEQLDKKIIGLENFPLQWLKYFKNLK